MQNYGAFPEFLTSPDKRLVILILPDGLNPQVAVAVIETGAYEDCEFTVVTLSEGRNMEETRFELESMLEAEGLEADIVMVTVADDVPLPDEPLEDEPLEDEKFPLLEGFLTKRRQRPMELRNPAVEPDVKAKPFVKGTFARDEAAGNRAARIIAEQQKVRNFQELRGGIPGQRGKPKLGKPVGVRGKRQYM